MNKFIYYPSFSSGNSKGWLLKNMAMPSGVTSRFYDKNYDSKWYHPYTLLSCGHNIRIKDLREQMGLNDSIVIGDSGGYQIASGAMKFDKKLRDEILEWLENNSDIAMNLDIPPKLTMKNHFNEALQLSIENFDYFEKKQNNKTKFLNILQYTNDERTKQWFDAVKHFNFNGWAISGVMTPYEMLYAISLLIQNNEFDKSNNKFIHFLGVSSVTHFLILQLFEKVLNTRYNNNLIISTDSSSPNRATIFGTYYLNTNWSKLNFKGLTISKSNKDTYKLNHKLPCEIDCPACRNATYQNIYDWKDDSYMIMTNHNLHIFLNAIRMIDIVLESHDGIIQDILSSDYYNLINLIKKILLSDKPLDLLYANKPFLDNISDRNTDALNMQKTNNLFEF